MNQPVVQHWEKQNYSPKAANFRSFVVLLRSPKHQSGENLVCPTGKNEMVISSWHQESIIILPTAIITVEMNSSFFKGMCHQKVVQHSCWHPSQCCTPHLPSNSPIWKTMFKTDIQVQNIGKTCDGTQFQQVKVRDTTFNYPKCFQYQNRSLRSLLLITRFDITCRGTALQQTSSIAQVKKYIGLGWKEW